MANADGPPGHWLQNLAKDVLNQYYRRYVERTSIYPVQRWSAFSAALVIFSLRVYLSEGWFVVAYALGIYLLNLFIGFLTPQVRRRRALRAK